MEKTVMLGTSDKIERAIEDVVRERLLNINIERVDVEEGEDHDGDRAFFVRIIFDSKITDFDKSRLSGLTRHIRSRLSALGEDRFPYTRFVASDEFHGAAA
jgi:hypothetical protein